MTTTQQRTRARNTIGANEAQHAMQALPPHITPVGRHCKISSTSDWWIGNAQPTPDEIGHIKGIVLYNQRAYIFLKTDEALAVPHLIERLLSNECGDSTGGEERTTHE